MFCRCHETTLLLTTHLMLWLWELAVPAWELPLAWWLKDLKQLLLPSCSPPGRTLLLHKVVSMLLLVIWNLIIGSGTCKCSEIGWAHPALHFWLIIALIFELNLFFPGMTQWRAQIGLEIRMPFTTWHAKHQRLLQNWKTTVSNYSWYLYLTVMHFNSLECFIKFVLFISFLDLNHMFY